MNHKKIKICLYINQRLSLTKYHSKEILHFPASRSIYLTSIITKKEFQYCQYVAV